METPADREPKRVIIGTVAALTFANAESGFVVLKLDIESGYRDPADRAGIFTRVTAVGVAPEPRVGSRLRLSGRWTVHRSHGRRFEFERSELLLPQDDAGAAKYLASGTFQGIGPVLAQRIVEKLGGDALARIRDTPEVLAQVKGLRKPVREALSAALRAQFREHERLAFLHGLGLSAAQSRLVESTFGERANELLQRDPYLLAETITGIGFATADRIAQQSGLAADSVERARAALLHCLREGASDGHVFLPSERLFGNAQKLLDELPRDRFDTALEQLAERRAIVVEGEETVAVYLAALWADESTLAAEVVRLVRGAPERSIAGAAELEDVERASGFTLNDDQRAAVLGLLRHPVALLTGGPGVGKTTIVRMLVELAQRHGARIALASPTGRAARRMTEATGRPASTLHRLLGFDPRRGVFAFGRGAPLPFDLVIVDELSMLDVTLAARLFEALESPTRIVLVGDPNQLPSVGPGRVLGDLIASERLPVFRLARIYRQKRGGLIVENAHRMLTGAMPLTPSRGDLESDFYFFGAEDPRECAELVVDVATSRVPRQFGFDWLRDVQVLAPMYRGECGVDLLNERLRERVGGSTQSGLFGDALARRALHVGDRVIQTRNDYDKEVFNGDMGRVARIEGSGDSVGAWVAFPEREVFYSRLERSDLALAFAITVHRAQGSEYPVVVMPLAMQHSVMLRRNLVYTAVTRARRLLVLIGAKRALELAVDDAREDPRLSRLAERLRCAMS